MAEALPAARSPAMPPSKAESASFNQNPMERSFDADKLGFQPLRGLSPWPINPDDPASSVPSQESMQGKLIEYGYLLMDLSAEADKSFEMGDYERASQFYLALAKAAPSKSTAFVKLCASYVGLNQFEKALSSCRVAVTREGVEALDYARLVALTLQVRKQLSESDVKDLDAVFAHVSAERVDFMPLRYLKCDLGVRLMDRGRLEECTRALAAQAPNDPRTITYQWTLAVVREDSAAAQHWIEQARNNRMPLEGIQQMQAATLSLGHDAGGKETRRNLLIAAAVIAAIGTGSAGLWAQRRRLRASSAV
jgi:hypothetical protein